jgi:hypothetical protein
MQMLVIDGESCQDNHTPNPMEMKELHRSDEVNKSLSSAMDGVE